jgi:polyisoprenoid-binding protein YceI
MHYFKENGVKITYQIDPAHTAAHFVVRHMMITNVRGSFGTTKGVIVYDPDDLGQSRIEAEIDTSSIGTHDQQRDAHLKSADFLDVAKYPAITFRSTGMERAGGGELQVTGELTIHGVTRPVVLKVEEPSPESRDPFGNVRVGASATTKIKRSDFGLTWNAALETGGVLVGDEVKIELEISAIKSLPAAA